MSEWKQLYAEVLDREPPASLSLRVSMLAADAHADKAELGRSRRLALGLAAAAVAAAVLLVLALAAHSRGQTEPATPLPAPHPCIVGSPGCGPLPVLPTHGTPVAPGGFPYRPVPHRGLLRPGTYRIGSIHAVGVINAVFTVPAGWSWNGHAITKGNAAVSFYAPPGLMYADPCHWDRPQHPAVLADLASTGDIMNALAAQPMRYATHPIYLPASLTGIGGRVWNTFAMRLTVPSNLDISRCDRGQYRTWGLGANTLRAQGAGQRDLIWIAVFNPGQITAVAPGWIVDAATFPTTPTRLVHQVDTILASVASDRLR